MTILEAIFANKRLEVKQRSQEVPLAEMRRRAEAASPVHDFCPALRRPGPGSPVRLIAEIKRASPSRGVLAQDFNPLRLAAAYQDGGAAAISVLTDERYFQGSLADLNKVAALPARPPLLCKDFLYDEYQVYEARAAGADAILLIAASIERHRLTDLQDLAQELGLAALVEVHNETELELALACHPALVGINNRDLHSFTVSLDTCLRLRPDIPPGIVTVAESGIKTRADVERLHKAGFDAILVGELLMTAPNPAGAIRSLLG